MKRNIRIYLDYIPLIILQVSAILLVWTVATTTTALVWKHYVGLILLVAATVLFFVRHLYGVLSVAVILLVGLAGFLSFSPGITTFSFGMWNMMTPNFQPIFLLWIVIYLIISGRHLIGVLSREYWIDVKNNSRTQIGETHSAPARIAKPN